VVDLFVYKMYSDLVSVLCVVFAGSYNTPDSANGTIAKPANIGEYCCLIG